MKIEYYWDREDGEVTATLTDDDGKEHHIPGILGDFDDELDCELSAIDEADRLDLLTRKNKKELTRKAYMREEMRERGRKRWEGIPPNLRSEFAKKIRKAGK